MTEIGARETDGVVAVPICAAVDKALGYGADSFVTKPKTEDPWGKECFVTLADALIDHENCWYLLPTVQAARDAEVDMPKMLVAARSRNDISPAIDKVAADIILANQYIEQQFDLLDHFVKREGRRIRQYDEYHRTPELRRSHFDAIPKFALESTLDYCRRNQPRVDRVESTGRLKKGELMYVFDEVLRTVREQVIAEPLGACYFAHPIKSDFALPSPPHCQTDKYSINWSWGSIIVDLVTRGQVPRNPEAVMDMVHTIRSEVRGQHASKHVLKDYNPKQQLDALTAVACDAKLPAVVKNDVIAALGIVFGLAASLAPNYTYKVPLAVASSGLGFLLIRGRLTGKEITIPGGAAKYLKICRGLLKWRSETGSRVGSE